MTFDVNAWLSGAAGAAVLGGIIWLIKFILDRAIPKRSDARAQVSLALDGLKSVVEVLQEEKAADAARLEAKQKRIEYLESAANRDYDRISDLRAEIIDLRRRLATKDRHIAQLIYHLERLGVKVSGENGEDIEITISEEQIREVRNQIEGPKEKDIR